MPYFHCCNYLFAVPFFVAHHPISVLHLCFLFSAFSLAADPFCSPSSPLQPLCSTWLSLSLLPVRALSLLDSPHLFDPPPPSVCSSHQTVTSPANLSVELQSDLVRQLVPSPVMLAWCSERLGAALPGCFGPSLKFQPRRRHLTFTQRLTGEQPSVVIEAEFQDPSEPLGSARRKQGRTADEDGRPAKLVLSTPACTSCPSVSCQLRRDRAAEPLGPLSESWMFVPAKQ